ncbi:uncharacterized protein LOC124808514 [Hydra vulgaris]|uniref:uncharacterized protein LOC124808514 n=1 Tax=Hydra vulgaris TaxID=6087 RepID=UPI0032EA35F8
MVLARKVLDCSHGIDRNDAAKKAYKNKTKTKITEHSCMRSYINVQDTKKFECPAQVILKEIIYFKDYMLAEPNTWKKKKISLKIKNLLKNKSDIGFTEKRIKLIINDISEHRNHAVREVS